MALAGDAERLREVYAYTLALPSGWSLRDTGRVYSWGWSYSEEPPVLRLWLCSQSVAEVAGQGGQLVVRVYSVPGVRCWEQGLEELAQRLGLGEDYSGFHMLASGDPLADCIPRDMPGYRLRSPTAWEALLIAVAQQNASFRQGWGMLYRLHAAASRRLRGPGWVFLEPPEPRRGIGEAARGSGWGYRARVLEGLAELARRHGASSPSLVEEAPRLRGVGAYTYRLARLLALRDYGSLPLDRWLRRLASEAYGVDEAAVAGELARRFQGWEGLAALAATICFDAEPLRRALERLRRGQNRPGLREPSPVTLWKHTPPPVEGLGDR